MIKAIRKSDGKEIEVREWRGASDVVYSTLDMNEFYQESDLDFLPEKETAVLEGWICRDKTCDRLWICSEEPQRYSNWWIIDTDKEYIKEELPSNLFPSVTWESEPKKVKITIEEI